jgi:hypothetical protein
MMEALLYFIKNPNSGDCFGRSFAFIGGSFGGDVSAAAIPAFLPP